jgi:carbon-monoxide dehydrogenase medium subunit
VKPQSFAYRAPATLSEALGLLAEHGDDAKILAGGQSLVPLLNLRLARPDLLVDVNRLPGLAEVAVDGAEVRVGALIRHRDLENPSGPAAGVASGPLGRLLARAARHVGHPPIRARGTVCGSLAHADPAAEWCLVGLAAGASVEVAAAGGGRRLAVDDLLDSPLVTTLRADEMITAVRFPRWAEGRVGAGFAERARTAGAFAELAACAVVEAAAGGAVVAAAAVAVAGLGGRPTLLAATGRGLLGQPMTTAVARAAGESAAAEADTSDGYARAAVAALVEDVLVEAFGEVVPGWRSS